MKRQFPEDFDFIIALLCLLGENTSLTINLVSKCPALFWRKEFKVYEETFWGEVNVPYLVSGAGSTGYTLVRTHCAEQLRCVYLTVCKFTSLLKKEREMKG